MMLCDRPALAAGATLIAALLFFQAGVAAALEPVTIDAVLADTPLLPERIEWEADGGALRLFLKGQAGAADAGLRVPLDGGRTGAIPFRTAPVQPGTGRAVTVRSERVTPAPPAKPLAKDEPQRTVLGDEPVGIRRLQTVLEQKHPDSGRTERWTLSGRLSRWGWGTGDRLYATVFPGPEAETADVFTSVLRLDPGAEPAELLRVSGMMQGMAPVLSPDGTRLALAYDSHTGRWDDDVSLHVLELATGKVTRLDSAGAVTSEYAWTSNDDLLFIQRDSGWNHLSRIGADGAVRQLTFGQHRVHGLALSPLRDKAAFLTEDALGRRDVRVLELATGALRIVHVADDPGQRLQLGKIRRVEWQAQDGLRLKGFLVLPPDFDPGRRYGLFVDVHGGGPGSRVPVNAPLALAYARGPLAWHRLASLGWVVFVADYRSSGDYGPASTARRYGEGDFTGIEQDADDVADGIRALRQETWVDGGRIVGFGHSAGGARVHSLLVRTDLFRAAILNESIGPGAIAALLYLTTGPNAGHRFDAVMQLGTGASYRDRPERFTQGYLFDGWRIKAPTLIMSGANTADGATSPIPHEVLLSTLREAGVPARYVRYDKEGHNYRARAVVRDSLREIEAWLQAHAG